MAPPETSEKPSAAEILGLDEKDMKYGTGYAAYSSFARSGVGRWIYRGIWGGIGVLTVVVFIAALTH